MAPVLGPDALVGWSASPNTRGTLDILYSCLSTIWLGTWTSLCLNIRPASNRRRSRRGNIWHKAQWQLLVIFFPEVLVGTAAEQWLEARQSTTAFTRLGHPEWTIRHGFFAGMGGILVQPRNGPAFAVDAQQLAYLVEHKYLAISALETLSQDDILAYNKADTLTRIAAGIQMSWFAISCLARLISRTGISPLEIATLGYIICTLHFFFFWFRKPLDSNAQKVFPLEVEIQDLCPDAYTTTPLDFVKPPPDAKSLVTPFWFGFKAALGRDDTNSKSPAQSFPNSRACPQDGMSIYLLVYELLVVQAAFYGLHLGLGWLAEFPTTADRYLWTLANSVCFGTIVVYLLALPAGTYLAPFLGRRLFGIEATGILDVATALPRWAKVVVHAPFVGLYVLARTVVLVESFASLRALPSSVYQQVEWANFLPHI
jgi:hypothetical protein